MNALEAVSPQSEVVVDGVFDLSAAREILRAVDAAPFDREVRIDLSRVREFHDFAVALLAEAISVRRERVIVAGLRVHQVRLLRGLGLGEVVERRDEPADDRG